MSGSPPLDGVRVLDLTRLIPGGYCTWLLSALGADVVKIEDTASGDWQREFGAQVDGAGACYHLLNRGKQSVALDLKSDGGRQGFLALLESADAVIESFRPGVMARLGLAPHDLVAQKPSLVVVSLSGFGASGSMSLVPGHDLNYLAVAGFLDRLGQPGTLPPVPPFPFADLMGGVVAALSATAMVTRARATGTGGHVDTSLAESVALLPTLIAADHLAGASVPGRGDFEWGGGLARYALYQLRDGVVAVGAVEERFWREMCLALGDAELADDYALDDQASLRERLRRHFAAMDAADVERTFAEAGGCVTLVQSVEDLLESDYAVERQMIVRDPALPMPVLAPPFMIDGSRPGERGPAPRHGEHTVEILRAAGLEPAVVEAMVSSGAALDGRAREDR